MEFKNLNGKTVLITGAARRIGRAIALSLAAGGARILAHYNRSAEEMESLVKEVEAIQGQIIPIQADLQIPPGVEQLCGRAEQAGGYEILINNASIFEESRLADFSREELFTNIQINSFAPLQLCRHFRKQQLAGSIINLLDTRVLDYDNRHVAYHLSKRMLFSLTRMLALEYAPLVRVNAIAPGVILPPRGRDESYYREMVSTNPLQTHGSPEDICGTVLFLLNNTFITGQVIFVDGGRHLKGCMYG